MKTDYVQGKHGLSKHPLMIVRNSIKQRCYNKNEAGYYLYGGRGISLCEEWRINFKSFYDWCMSNGWKKGLHIDRIDNNGNYCPENCRIITPSENAQNKRNSVKITYMGKTLSITKWAKELDIDKSTLRHRYNLGLPLPMVFSIKTIRTNFVKDLNKHNKMKGRKLLNPEVQGIKKLIREGFLKNYEIAALFSVTYQTISKIKSGKTFASIK